MPALRIRRALSSSVWNAYFKFTIVRNPYDRAISQYFWNNRRPDKHTPEKVNDYIQNRADPYLLTNWHMYSHRDKVILDHFIRYECLQSGLEAVLRKLGISDTVDLPGAKKGHRPKSGIIVMSSTRRHDNALSKFLAVSSSTSAMSGDCQVILLNSQVPQIYTREGGCIGALAGLFSAIIMAMLMITDHANTHYN